jgi:hypothetical protein
MNNKHILPMEIVNKILIMRPPHPIANIIKPFINNYNDYTNNDDYISFVKYTLNYYDLYYTYNIRCNKKYDNDILSCYSCDNHIQFGDLFFSNRNYIQCTECF